MQNETNKMTPATDDTNQAKRHPVDYRYDILVPEFIKMMAEIASYGAARYGDYNWQKSRLTGDKGPINHIYEHLHSYQTATPHDRFGTTVYHLGAIAFNAMMEYWYATKFRPEPPVLHTAILSTEHLRKPFETSK